MKITRCNRCGAESGTFYSVQIRHQVQAQYALSAQRMLGAGMGAALEPQPAGVNDLCTECVSKLMAEYKLAKETM